MDPSAPNPVHPRSTDDLFSELYHELRKIAAQRMARERPSDTLRATELVSEAWLRLQKDHQKTWDTEQQLIAAASEVMRRILVDRARKRLCQRNGGGLRRTDFLPEELSAESRPPERDLLVDEVLELFRIQHPDKVVVVELKYFSGLGYREIASLLETSESSVRRSWKYAKVWLTVEMEKRL